MTILKNRAIGNKTTLFRRLNTMAIKSALTAPSDAISKNSDCNPFDQRVKDKKLARNELAQEAWDNYLKALPDDAKFMMTIEEYEEKLKNSQL